jgi:hypothetical protein
MSKAGIACLRLASVVSAVFAGGHTYGTLAILNGPSHDQLTQQIVLVEGIAKTYADLFAGYGFIVTALLLLQALLLWLLAAARGRGISVTVPVALLALASGVNGFLSHLYLIHIPLAFLLLITALLVTSLMLMRSKP